MRPVTVGAGTIRAPRSQLSRSGLTYNVTRGAGADLHHHVCESAGDFAFRRVDEKTDDFRTPVAVDVVDRNRPRSDRLATAGTRLP